MVTGAMKVLALAVALLLGLTSTAVASTEAGPGCKAADDDCAWVLWTPVDDRGWLVISKDKTLPDCLDTLQFVRERLAEKKDVKDPAAVYLACLPAGVKP